MWKIVEPLGGRASLREICYLGQDLRIYRLVLWFLFTLPVDMNLVFKEKNAQRNKRGFFNTPLLLLENFNLWDWYVSADTYLPWAMSATMHYHKAYSLPSYNWYATFQNQRWAMARQAGRLTTDLCLSLHSSNLPVSFPAL